MPRWRRSPRSAPASRVKGLGRKFLPPREQMARGTVPGNPIGCRLSTRFSSCALPASTLPSPRSSWQWLVSRRSSDGTRNSAQSLSSKGRWSRASTGARSRLARTSVARRRAWRAVLSASSSTTAVGTAKRRRVRARHFIPPSACWRDCSSTSVPSGPAEIAAEITAARRRGEQYLLERDLFRRRSTGEVANTEFLELAFPPRYHYDVLRALDYFRNAGVLPNARMSDGVHFIESRRQADGRWLLDRAYDEALAFRFSEAVGEPSRWNTLRALRVLRWYERPEPT